MSHYCHCHHGHCGAKLSKSLEQDRRQQSTARKIETIVAMGRIKYVLLFLWFVAEYGQNGHCHGQLNEQRLSCLLVVDKLLNLGHFGLLTCQFCLEIELRL
jgi:hypothetical protein